MNSSVPIRPGAAGSTAGELLVSEDGQEQLQAIGKWGRVLAIFGFITAGLFISTTLLSALLVAQDAYSAGAAVGSSMITTIFVLIIYVLPAYYVWRMSKAIPASQPIQEGDLTTALRYLKNWFIFMGVYTILVMALFAFAFLIGALT